MGRSDLWVVILAGGEGRRLRPLVDQMYGDLRPKQFAGPIDGRGMLDQTLQRTRPLVPAERTIVMSVASQRAYLPAALANHRGVRVYIQPEDRGTAAAILWPSVRIAGLHPGAQVLVVPSDHFVGDEEEWRRQVRAAADRRPVRPVLFGVMPESAEADYGWIEIQHEGHEPADPLFRVKGFVEKPDRELADECFRRGDLWNTLLLLADAMTLIDITGVSRPDLLNAFGRVYRSPKPYLVDAAYAAIPHSDFSKDVLATVPRALSAWRLPALRWTDLGTVDRVLDRLRTEGYEPWWRSVTSARLELDDGRAGEPIAAPVPAQRHRS